MKHYELRKAENGWILTVVYRLVLNREFAFASLEDALAKIRELEAS